jgi:chromosome segregation ATPase
VKNRIKYLLMAGVTFSVLALTPIVLAEDGNSNSESSNSTTNKTLKQRVEEHKNTFKLKLNSTEILRLKGKCGSAQDKIKTYRENINANVPARVKAYQNLQSRLTSLVEKLKAANIDTSTLEQQLTVLDQKIDTFNDNLATYKQQLADLKDIDCTSDPDGFKAALEAARETRKKLAAEIADIKAYVKETIKPTLQTIRQQLEAQEQQE